MDIAVREKEKYLVGDRHKGRKETGSTDACFVESLSVRHRGEDRECRTNPIPDLRALCHN